MWVAAALLLSSPQASAQPFLSVQWVDARLAVIAHEVPLGQVLREIARQTGIEIFGLERLRHVRSVEFADQFLADGLELLLEDLDYVMAVRDPVAQAVHPPPGQPVMNMDEAGCIGECQIISYGINAVHPPPPPVQT